MAGEWREAALGDVIELKRGFDLPQQHRARGNFPIVSSSGVSDYHSVPKVKGPGVVTGRYGTIGEVFFIRKDFWPLNTTLYVCDFKGNDPRFVSYLLRTVNFFAYSDKAAVPGVNRNHLHSARVFVPTETSEQQAIARVLGTLDDKTEVNRQMNETLEGMALALFKSWFVSFDPVYAKAEGRTTSLPESLSALFPSSLKDSEIGYIPKGWAVSPLLSDCKLLSGGTPKTDRDEYWHGDIPWASAKDVSQAQHTFLIATERTITRRGLEESATQLIPPMSTVIVARGATTGRMVVFGCEMAMNQTCYAVCSTSKTPFVLYCLLRHSIASLVHAAHGSVFDTITTSTFAQARVIEIPHALKARFEALVSPLFERILMNIKQSQTLVSLRDTLLPKLISGELRLPDAERIVGEQL